MNYISSSFFHYTRELSSVEDILSGGFGMFYCREEIYSDKGCGTIEHIGIPMCSFCDIPLGYISSNTYGKYVIGMRRSWGTSVGLLPVMYYPNNKKVLSTKLVIEATKAFRSDPADTKKYSVLGFAKPMRKLASSAKSKYPRDNYREREWRKVYSPDSKFKWLCKEEYDSYRKAVSSERKPLVGSPLRFGVEDIDMIIVPRQDVPKLISYISSKSFTTIGGNKGQITDSQRYLLISKITPFDSLSENI